MQLQDLVINSSKRYPNSIAVKAEDGCLTYSELNSLANRIARALAQLGVLEGDRVALWLDKSVRTVAAMQAILRLGAAYVPIDPQSPVMRVQAIMKNCQIKALVTNYKRAEKVLVDDFCSLPSLSTTEKWQNGISWKELNNFSDEPLLTINEDENQLAYILYTSGSTGIPKGVCISHRNALAFVEWATEEMKLVNSDRLSNHAPFHFDLSVFDLYAAFLSGASVNLIPEGISYLPTKLVEFLQEHQITVCYCVPSALVLMIEHAKLLEQSLPSLRAIIFAGEPFAIKYLRRLRDSWPTLRLLNWYGPTETNVCTSYEVFEIEKDRNVPVPIGKPCCGDEAWPMKINGEIAQIEEEGELIVSGPTIMLGYWGLPPQNNQPYATGDIVRLQADGNYIYIGRRDHMVKIRGHRIELGDIEAALLEHEKIKEVGVVVIGSGLESRLAACITCVDNQKHPTLLEIKQHCAKRLPRYMIIDEIHFNDSQPRTSTGKINRKELKRMLEES